MNFGKTGTGTATGMHAIQQDWSFTEELQLTAAQRPRRPPGRGNGGAGAAARPGTRASSPPWCRSDCLRATEYVMGGGSRAAGLGKASGMRVQQASTAVKPLHQSPQLSHRLLYSGLCCEKIIDATSCRCASAQASQRLQSIQVLSSLESGRAGDLKKMIRRACRI